MLAFADVEHNQSVTTRHGATRESGVAVYPFPLRRQHTGADK